jgi:hypothetical protein
MFAHVSQYCAIVSESGFVSGQHNKIVMGICKPTISGSVEKSKPSLSYKGWRAFPNNPKIALGFQSVTFKESETFVLQTRVPGEHLNCEMWKEVADYCVWQAP